MIFGLPETVDRGTEIHFRYAETAVGEAKMIFASPETVSRGARDHFRDAENCCRGTENHLLEVVLAGLPPFSFIRISFSGTIQISV